MITDDTTNGGPVCSLEGDALFLVLVVAYSRHATTSESYTAEVERNMEAWRWAWQTRTWGMCGQSQRVSPSEERERNVILAIDEEEEEEEGYKSLMRSHGIPSDSVGHAPIRDIASTRPDSATSAADMWAPRVSNLPAVANPLIHTYSNQRRFTDKIYFTESLIHQM